MPPVPIKVGGVVGGIVVSYSDTGALVFPVATTGFPPVPTGVQPAPGLPNVIPSYLYYWYRDDEDLQAFVASQNDITQSYVDWFNQIGLPYYPGELIQTGLLDWVAQGLYGMARPVLPSGTNQWLGEFNTYEINTVEFNGLFEIGTFTFYAVNDDFFKRILTWHLYKGDGKNFNVRWLKRRIMRFLNGINGVDGDTSTTYQVSVTFGVENQASIRISPGTAVVNSGAIFNDFELNTQEFDALQATFTPGQSIDGAQVLVDAVNFGVLELPFQYTWTITAG